MRFPKEAGINGTPDTSIGVSIPMKIFYVLLVGFGGIVIVTILLDFPAMGGLLTALRLILLAMVVGIVWIITGLVTDLQRNGRNDD